MKYQWRDYKSRADVENADGQINNASASDWQTAESFLDDEARKMTGIDTSWDENVSYWMSCGEFIAGKAIWCKIIGYNGVSIAVILISESEGQMNVMEFCLSPAMRGAGHGSAIISELLSNGGAVIGHPIKRALAVIYPNNKASIKAFVKAGFHFLNSHPDGDAWYFEYNKNDERNRCYCGHDCSCCTSRSASLADSDILRAHVRDMYKTQFGIDIASADIFCEGGRSEHILPICSGCPFMRCAKEKRLSSCESCGEYPCGRLSDYMTRYVNRLGQI